MWNLVKLDNLFHFKNGRSFKKQEWKERGLPIIRIQNLNDVSQGYNYYEGDYDKLIEVNSGDLLFSWSGTVGSSFGPHIWDREKGVLNQHIYKLSKKQAIDTKYAFYCLKKITREIEQSVVGAVGLVHVTKKNLVQFKIPLPPLVEQQRIVAKLDSVFSEINKAKKADQYILLEINKLKECIIESSLSKMNLENYKYKLQDLLDLGWIESHLDCNHGSDYPRKNEFIDSGVPYISANCLNNGSVTKINMKFLSKDRASRLRKGIAKNGDILFAHNATVGPTALLETHESKVILGTSLTYYRCQKQKINNKYLMIYMQSRLFIDQYKFVMRQATRNQVPITKQRKFDFIIPPLEMQLSISDKILKIENYIKKLSFDIEKRKRQYDSLKSVILSREFKLEAI